MYDIARYVCLLFSLPVLFLLGPSLANDAWEGAMRGRIESSLLLLVGVLASFAYSAISVFQGRGHVYFEVGVVVLVAVTLGRWLEAQGKLRTTQALRDLQTLLPALARRLEQNEEQLVPLETIRSGDLLRILPGERIPVDGRITQGRAAIDEQMVTGESLPVEKGSGATVFSGTLNLDGELLLQATAAAHAGTLQRLIDSVTNAVSQQTNYQRLADKIAAWFLPLIAVFAGLTWGMHAMSGQPADQGILAALAVVVISCPCALGLATPLALWAAIGRAAQRQVLFRHGDALARLAQAKVICFDKTGTLTTGQLVVEQHWSNTPAAMNVAYHLATKSNHPAAKALLEYTRAAAQQESLSNLREFPGRGIQATSTALGCDVFLGNLRWLMEQGVNESTWTQTNACREWQDRSLVFLAWAGEVRGVFALQEHLRAETADTIAALKKLGLQVHLLTGDRAGRAQVLADSLGIQVAAELLPEQKLERVARLRQQFGPVIMVGDGLNDAPALAAADIGIALGCGADLSRDAAGVCLIGNQLDRIPWAISLARDANRTIRWNLFWAFAYNIAGIPLAALGLVNPILAAIAMAVSSGLVTTNSLRLAGETSDTAEAV